MFPAIALARSQDLDQPIPDRSLDYLEERRISIEEELSQLARYSLRSCVGPIGFRSKANETSDTTETFQINLGKGFQSTQSSWFQLSGATRRRDSEQTGFHEPLRQLQVLGMKLRG